MSSNLKYINLVAEKGIYRKLSTSYLIAHFSLDAALKIERRLTLA